MYPDFRELKKRLKYLFKDLKAVLNLKFLSNYIHSVLFYTLIVILNYMLFRRGHIN